MRAFPTLEVDMRFAFWAVALACGGFDNNRSAPPSADPLWCYTVAEREEKPPPPPCLSREDWIACYLDAEQRAEIAHGAPDVRPAWCFDGGTR
jgi:hypothetical protein